MADILIKGMEMPQTGNLVVCISSDGTVTVPYDYTLHFETPVPQTKAIELPPHGRLGDLDKLAEEFDGHGIYMEEEVKKIIDFFPTIVEANYGTDN